MQKKNALCAGLAFLMILIAVYFGVSIHNANTNSMIDYLNEMDNLHYYDVNEIPELNYTAAILTLPLIITILIVEVLIAFQSNVRQVKNIAIGLTMATLIILVADIILLINPANHDFSRMGYIWITMGIFIAAGNALSLFIKGNSKNLPKKV